MRLGLIPVISVLLLIGFSFASSPVIASNSILPASGWQYLTQKYSLNVTNSIGVNSIVWTFNGVPTAYGYNNILTGIFNFTAPAYNGIGNVIISANVIDSSGNFMVVTENSYYQQYILPSIGTILPTLFSANQLITFSASVTPGSFPVNQITWEFQSHYYTNIAYNGSNYQSYDFKTAGSYLVIAQVCDTNAFCSSKSQQVTPSGSAPNSYWTVRNSTILGSGLGKTGGIPFFAFAYPNRESIHLIFQPNNDTNPIQSVTFNWGDGKALVKTTYGNGVQADTYYYTYASVGNYTISVSVCDAVQNCNTTVLAQVLYRQTLSGQVGSLLLNTNPQTSVLSQIGSDIANVGATIFGAVIEIIAAIIGLGAIAFFGGIFLLGWAKKHGYIS